MNKLREERIKKDLRVCDVTRAVKISETWYYHFELNRKKPTKEQAERLNKFFGKKVIEADG